MSHEFSERKSFGSDNHAGVHPDVMRAIVEANQGDALPYGADPWTERARDALLKLFGASGDVMFVLNGSGANVLGLSLLLRRHEAVICAESAHTNADECGASEQVLGTKLLTAHAPDGKLTPALIEPILADRGNDRRAQPGVVSITQSTELGTCYTIAELREIRELCAANDLRVYIDGARLANGAAYLGCPIADIAAHADVLSFGGTKNGALGAEALVIMRPEHVTAAPYLHKQLIQHTSKMRFVAAQFLALIEGDLWLKNASHANAMAARLADGLTGLPDTEICYPVQADSVFARLSPEALRRLRQDWFFHDWNARESLVRLMTAFDTRESDVDDFLATAALAPS